MNLSTRQKWITAAAVAGALIGSAGIASALGSSTTNRSNLRPTEVTTPGTGSTSGTVANQSNEDKTHEAGESAQREADENSGKAWGNGGPGHGPWNGGPGHGHHSNTDPAHEASESPQRAAEEAKQDATLDTTATSTTTKG
jgi:hypothetical protein